MKTGIKQRILATLLALTCILQANAEDRIELEVTTIKGNKELPKILYVVPWQDMKSSKSKEQKLVLHSLFGDLFEPVIPALDKED